MSTPMVLQTFCLETPTQQSEGQNVPKNIEVSLIIGPGRWSNNLKSVTWIGILNTSCEISTGNAANPRWWYVNIVSGIVLRRARNKPSAEPMLNHSYCRIMTSLGHSESNHSQFNMILHMSQQGERYILYHILNWIETPIRHMTTWYRNSVMGILVKISYALNSLVV